MKPPWPTCWRCAVRHVGAGSPLAPRVAGLHRPRWRCGRGNRLQPTHAAACASWNLQVLLFHRDAFESLSEDALLELCDWCSRKLLYLATEAHQHAQYRGACAGAALWGAWCREDAVCMSDGVQGGAGGCSGIWQAVPVKLPSCCWRWAHCRGDCTGAGEPVGAGGAGGQGEGAAVQHRHVRADYPQVRRLHTRFCLGRMRPANAARILPHNTAHASPTCLCSRHRNAALATRLSPTLLCSPAAGISQSTWTRSPWG